MAEKGPGSSQRSQGKRLARAKVKPTENGIKSSKRQTVAAPVVTKTQQKRDRKQKVMGVIVGIFAVIMALSMMLPSFAYIFGNDNANEAAAPQDQEATSEEAQDEGSDEGEETGEGDEAEQAETTTSTTMDKIDANYKTVIDPLEEKLKDAPDDLATLLNLGNDYLAWGSTASSYATDEESAQHVIGLFNKAIEYFDHYLELNDSNAVRTNRAMALLYSGGIDDAVKALKKVTKDAPDYGPAWANLGLISEYQGDSEGAKDYYDKAIEADPDDEYGSKSFANQRLAAMAASKDSALTSDNDISSKDDDPVSGIAALENALNAKD